jgi:Arc/MetJ-type ribon-helix-helix transcriptional regulator
MGVITVSIDDEVEKDLREKIDDRKGALGSAITEALKEWIKDKEQEKYRKRALKRLEEGYDMGEIQYEHRSELHDRLETSD